MYIFFKYKKSSSGNKKKTMLFKHKNKLNYLLNPMNSEKIDFINKQ